MIWSSGQSMNSLVVLLEQVSVPLRKLSLGRSLVDYSSLCFDARCDLLAILRGKKQCLAAHEWKTTGLMLVISTRHHRIIDFL